MQEFAFDVKLAAVIRVKAETEAEARAAMENIVDAMDISEHFIAGYNQTAKGVMITEVSLSEDDAAGPYLFEIDGEVV